MNKTKVLTGALLGVLLLTAGCGATASAGNGSTGTTAPSTASSSSNSPASTNSAQTAPVQTASSQGNAEQGKQLFQTNCSSCHSTGNNKIVGPGLKGIYSKSTLPNGQAVNDQDVVQWIKTGDAQMPGNPALSAADLANISAYLKTLK